MAVSYKKLWKLLIDKDMKKKELISQTNLKKEFSIKLIQLLKNSLKKLSFKGIFLPNVKIKE